MSNFYGATGLIGGNSGDLDNIDGTNLASGDGAFVITSTGLYIYYLNATSGASESSPDIISPDANAGNKRWILIDIIGEDAIFELLKLYDTDKTHTLSVKWNEDDSGDRVLNVLVAGGDRSLTLNENLTVGDGGNVTITAEDAAGSITLDNASLEVEDTIGSGNTIKFVIGTDDASRTVTLSENLTIGDGYDITLTAEDTAGSIVLDKQTFEVEGEGTATRLFKLKNSADSARTLTFAKDLTIGDPSANECNLATASNADIDTGTETVDSFADTLGEGAVWFYVVIDNDDVTNRRAGQVIAAWDATNDTIEYTETSTLDVGTTDVTLAVDIDSNTVRLRATAGSDNWTVRCQRMVL